MDNSKPDFWKECPQILSNWHNIFYILSGVLAYFMAKEAETGYSVLIALFVVVVLYTVSYIVRYHRYSREKNLPKTNDQDSDQDYHTLSVVYDRRDNNGKNYCSYTTGFYGYCGCILDSIYYHYLKANHGSVYG